MDSAVTFTSSTKILGAGGSIPPVIVLAAIADWKTPLAG